MGKRQRELTKLKVQAEELWEDQKDLLENAGHVIKEAGKQAVVFAKDEVTPRVRGSIDTGFTAAKSAASSTGEKIKDDVFPVIAGSLAAAGAATHKVGEKVGLVKPPKPSGGVGKYILIALGVVALAGVAYAIWQTLRADDDLWVEEEDPAPIDEPDPLI